MSGQLADRHRTVVPRWRIFARTAALRALRQGDAPTVRKEDEYAVRERAEAFHAEPTVWHAADLLNEALLLNDADFAKEAAEFIVSAPGALPLAKATAERVLGGESEERVAPEGPWLKRLHSLRQFARSYPNNPIAWIDTALAYTVLGSRNQAERTVRTALRLAKDNSFILRSAVRFYVHQNDLERAHALLIASTAILSDPWLLSAEIAVSNARKRTSRLLTVGRRVVDDASFRAYDRSELAAALATIEHESGTPQKRIRKLLKQSLVDPTENAVAQAEWLTNRNHSLDALNIPSMNVPCVFEARAEDRFFAGKYEEAYDNAMKWLDDQPFSSRPAIMAAYIANTIFDDQVSAIEVAKQAIEPNPDDPVLLNDLAFSLASMDRPKEAERYINRAKRQTVTDQGLQIAMTATEGLIAFRNGDRVRGRQHYEAAIASAKAKNRRREFELATIYLAQETFVSGEDGALPLALEAAEIARKTKDPIVTIVAQRALKTFLK